MLLVKVGLEKYGGFKTKKLDILMLWNRCQKQCKHNFYKEF